MTGLLKPPLSLQKGQLKTKSRFPGRISFSCQRQEDQNDPLKSEKFSLTIHLAILRLERHVLAQKNEAKGVACVDTNQKTS